jgi:hypothetical protein
MIVDALVTSVTVCQLTRYNNPEDQTVRTISCIKALQLLLLLTLT